MLRYRFAKHSDKTVMELHFECAGDTLNMHKHFEGNYHDTVLKQGKAAIYGPGERWWAEPRINRLVKLSTEHQEHEIMALEDDTVVWNVYHNDMPQLEEQIGKDWEAYP